MKKIITILVFICLLFSITYSEEYTTPTDLYEIEDISDEEQISINELYPNHHIEIKVIQHAHALGDEVILGFDLIDYPPGEITYIEWQYSENSLEWFPIEDENDETLKFIVTKENYRLWYRVMIEYHYNLNI